jgi:primosomal protein N' (replication factor Y)
LGHTQRITDWQQRLHLAANRYRPLAEAPQVCMISLPPVQIVDLRDELKAGNRSVFSMTLQQAVDTALQQGQQAILFLNRRGTATHVFCRDCGWVASCPNCAIPLTYHARSDMLICHHCAHRQGMVKKCPACGSRRVRAFGLGTEKLEQEVAERWPQARLARWDRDVARTHVAHTSLLTRFAAGEADILIGTQMIARGLDFPGVTVVGIISADVGLHLPDFRAAERTFQLLTQVAGRAGRGLLGGRVVLQTYHPEHYAVQYAAVHDYTGFAERELAFRKETGYPPTMRMAKLVVRNSRAIKARAAAEALATSLREKLAAAGASPMDLIGPAPAFFARVRGYARWQILLRSVDPAAFLRTVTIPAGWQVDIDPVDVL